MPWDIARLVEAVVNRYPNLTIGAHMHNDLGLAVANTLEAVRAGARYVETAFNGYGERTGNADSVCVIADLQLKLKYEVLPESSMIRLNSAAKDIAKLTGIPLPKNAPWYGSSAWGHKAGCHSSAVRKYPELYEHTPPETVGAKRVLVMSEQLGQAAVLHKAEELGLPTLSATQVRLVVDQFKNLGLEGGDLEGADGTVELLMRRALSGLPDYFHVKEWRSVTGENLTAGNEADATESSASLVVENGQVHCTTHRLNGGPVAALDGALRKCLLPEYPHLADLTLEDLAVQIKGAPVGVQSTVVASVRWLYKGEELTTVGVSQNMMAACLKALTDAYHLVLFRNSGTSIQDECLGVGA
jgi:2-isopropylmalate synthase